MGKSVTIVELKAAARARGWVPPKQYPMDLLVRIHRTTPGGVTWKVGVSFYRAGKDPLIVDVWHDSRQGAMRMALAALKAGRK